MELKQLGNSGVMVPEIGLGVWKYRGGVEPLRRGIELGAFLIDTAEVYGTEDVTGQAVKGIRDRVFIATKVSGAHLRHDEVLRAAESSLQKLGTDYIDLYQIHWPSSYAPIAETMRAMEALVDRKLVKYIGVSNFSLAELRAAQAALARRSKYPSNPEAMRALENVAAQVKKTLAQVALNWCTSRPGVIAIPKSNNADRVVENCGASGWRLSAEQMQLLDDAFSRADDDDD